MKPHARAIVLLSLWWPGFLGLLRVESRGEAVSLAVVVSAGRAFITASANCLDGAACHGVIAFLPTFISRVWSSGR